MPQLPNLESSIGYAPAAQPFADAGALIRPFDILAAGMKDAAANFAGAAARVQAAQQIADATALQTQAAKDLVDMHRRFQVDPDPGTVPQRAEAEFKAYQTRLLDGAPDDGVRGYLARYFSHAFPSYYSMVTGEALKRQTARQVDGLKDAVSQQTMLLMNARNEAEHRLAEHGIRAALDGQVTTGLISKHDAVTMFSRSIRTAVTSRSASDPGAAQSLLARYRNEMQPDDVAALDLHLRAPLERQQAMTAAQTITRGAPEQAASAGAVYQGLIQRGFDPDSAWAWTANAMAESRGRTDAVGDGGISHGLFQWNRDRAAAYQARYGHLPSQGTLDEALDFMVQELGGPEGRAKALIDQARGPAEKAAAISRYYLRPRDMEGEANRRSALAVQLAGGGGRPTLPMQIDEVKRLTEGAPFQVQMHAESLVRQAWHDERAALAPLIQQTRHQAADLLTRYENGMTDTDIPEDRIRSLLPPEEALRVVEQLRTARVAGDMFRAVAAASPEEEAQMRAALAVPGAVSSGLPRRDGRTVLPAPGQAQEGAESQDGNRLRLAYAAKLDELLRRKHQALAADPAAYVAGLPMMQERAQAADPNQPGQARDILVANLALQERLGLRPDQRRVLTNAAVAQIVERLHKTDPAEGDVAAEMTALASRFGTDAQGQDMWRRAFGELVQHGKLSPDYQVLAAMFGGEKDTPGQAGGRADFQRALAFRSQKGGMEQLSRDAPPDERRKIDQKLDETLADFRASTAFSQGGLGLFSAVRDSVRTLAYYYAYQGQSGATALDNAFERIIGDRYDMDGAMRVPKGRMDEVRRAALAAQVNLTLDDIAPPPTDPARPWETDGERRAAMLSAARQGFWIPNRDDSGLILMMRLHNNGQAVARRPDGTPIEIRFNALPPSDIAGLPAMDPMGAALPPGGR